MFGNLRINLKDYKNKKIIGWGTYSNVYLIESNVTHKFYAAKKFKFDKKDSYPETTIKFMQEVEKLINIKYPTIISLIGYSFRDFQNEPHPIIITNYLRNRSVKEMLQHYDQDSSYDDISDTQKYIIILGTSLGMKYLHSIGIVHRDLKPANILLNEKYYPLICDFGFSKKTNEKLKNFFMESWLGTPFYMAPEIKDAEKYSYKVDIYSFSLVVYQLITLKKCSFQFDINEIEGEENQQFLNRCHSEDPLIRPDFNEICLQFVKKSFLKAFSNIKINKVKKFFDFLLNEENDDLADTLYIYGIFLDENGSQKDKNEMMNYIKEAADKGNSNAMFFYAEKLYNGEYVKCNKKEAFKYYKNAAIKGNADAMLKCAVMLDEGDGIDKNKEEALFCYQKASNKGNKKAESVLKNKISSFFEYESDNSKEISYLNEPKIDMKEKERHETNEKKEADDIKKVSKPIIHKKKKRCCSTEKYMKRNKADYIEPNKSSNNADENKNCNDFNKLEVKNEANNSKPLMIRKINKRRSNSQGKTSMKKKQLYTNSDDKKVSESSDDKEENKNSDYNKNILSRKKSKGNKIIRRKKSKYSNKTNKRILIKKIESPKTSDDNDNDNNSPNLFNDDKTIEHFHSKEDNEKNNQTYKISKNKNDISRRSNSTGKHRNIKKQINIKSDRFLSDNNNENENDISDKLLSDDNELLKSLSDDDKKTTNENEKDENIKKEEDEDEKDQYDTEEDLIIEENSIVYLLSKKDQNAKVFQSQDKKKEIEIPKFIEHKSIIYKVVQISSESFLNSRIEVFKMINDENFTISQKSFDNCYSLKSIIIETNETIYIKENNFNRIPNLELFSIKAKEIIIDNNCFNECFIQQKNVLPQPGEKIIRIEGINNVSIGNACFKKLDLLEQIELKSNQIIIGNDCFDDCSNLSSLISKSNMFSLGTNQFRKCLNFQNFKLESAKIKLGTRCFSFSSIIKVDIFCEDITIGKFSFSDLLTIIEFSINKSNNVIIEENSFSCCHNLKNLSISSEKSLNINNSSFINLKSLQKIYIKCPKVIIGESCFMNCKLLSSIKFDNIIELDISDKAFTQCEALEELSLISNKNVHLKRYCFSDCKKLSSIKLKSNEIMIDEFCFENCSSLSSLTFYHINNLDIKSNSFKNCINLEKILIKRSRLVHLRSFCFFNASKLSSIGIDAEELIIDENCFNNCESLKCLIFDKVKNAVFNQCSFIKCSNLEKISIMNAQSLNFEEKCFCDNKNISFIEIESDELKIRNKFIDSCPCLKMIKLSSVQNIQITEDTFSECTSLSNIEINSKNSVNLTEKCFLNLIMLEQITIKSDDIIIDKKYFPSSKNLKFITIECSKLQIEEDYFKKCPNILSIFLNIQSANIGQHTFSDYSKLNTITIQVQSEITLNDSCFLNAINLKTIILDGGKVNICNKSFQSCPNLSSIIFKNVQNAFIGSDSFNQCEKLNTFEISATSCICLNNYCFNGANNLDIVKLRSKEIIIGEYCFKDCKHLSCLQINNAENCSIGSEAFVGCESLCNLKITVKSNLIIHNYCFNKAKKLKTISFECNYLVIGDFIFKNCPSIVLAEFKSLSGSQINDKAFSICPRDLKIRLQEILNL